MKTIIIASVSSVISLAAGAAGGYLVAQKRLEKRYNDLAEKEIAAAKAYYSRMYKQDDYADPVELAKKHEPDKRKEELEEVQTIMGEQGYISEPESRVLTPEQLEQELLDMTILEDQQQDRPYVIDRDDWFDQDAGYEHITLRYFEADDLLVGSDKSVMEDIDGVIGIANLGRFGYKSGDNTVVYVRNEEHQTDYEVVLDKGSYARDMLGFIEHSDEPKVRKFRRDDG